MKAFYIIALLAVTAGYSQTQKEDKKSGKTVELVKTSPGEAKEDNTIYNSAGLQVQPEFPGGLQEFQKYFIEKLSLDKINHKTGQGRVYVQFCIEKNGTTGNVRILRNNDFPELNEEIIKVILASPKWNPGIQDGKPVRTSFAMPVTINTNPKSYPVSPTLAYPDKGVKAPSDISSENAVYNILNIQFKPQFPGGEAAFKNFILSKFKKPKVEGITTAKILLSFVIEKDGSLTEVKAVNDPGNGIGDEAVRVAKLSPKWSPGLQNGKPVKTRYTIPIDIAFP